VTLVGQTQCNNPEEVEGDLAVRPRSIDIAGDNSDVAAYQSVVMTTAEATEHFTKYEGAAGYTMRLGASSSRAFSSCVIAFAHLRLHHDRRHCRATVLQTMQGKSATEQGRGGRSQTTTKQESCRCFTNIITLSMRKGSPGQAWTPFPPVQRDKYADAHDCPVINSRTAGDNTTHAATQLDAHRRTEMHLLPPQVRFADVVRYIVAMVHKGEGEPHFRQGPGVGLGNQPLPGRDERQPQRQPGAGRGAERAAADAVGSKAVALQWQPARADSIT